MVASTVKNGNEGLQMANRRSRLGFLLNSRISLFPAKCTLPDTNPNP